MLQHQFLINSLFILINIFFEWGFIHWVIIYAVLSQKFINREKYWLFHQYFIINSLSIQFFKIDLTGGFIHGVIIYAVLYQKYIKKSEKIIVVWCNLVQLIHSSALEELPKRA